MVCEKGGDRRMSGDSHQDARRGLAKAPAETSAARRGGEATCRQEGRCRRISTRYLRNSARRECLQAAAR